jgi:hypothetical protein
VIVRVIQRIHIGSQALAQSSRQLALFTDGGNGFEVGSERSEALGFDPAFVHERVVEIGDFARIGTGGSIGLGSLFDQT